MIKMYPDINLPQTIDIYEPKKPEHELSQNEIIQYLSDRDIIELLKRDNILIIINDHHRSTPSYRILEAIYHIIDKNNITHGIDTIAIATGTHDPPDTKKIRELTHNVEKKLGCKLLVHNCKGELNYLGVSSRGTPYYINPIVLNAKTIITINSVEPHYFAGFTGGIKSIIPGLAGYNTIKRNHSWALDSRSYPTSVENNPLQLDLWEIFDFIPNDNIYGIQMVSASDKIYHISFDKLRLAFNETVDASKKMYAFKIKQTYDIVISLIYPPLDRSLYQAQKGIENTRMLLKKGGEMILIAKCDDGVGNTAFFETISKYNNPQDLISDITRENYEFGDHKAYKFATLVIENKLKLVTDLDLNIVKKVFADKISINSLESYLMENSFEGKSIALIIDSGAVTFYE